jgi:flagellin
MSYSSGVNNVFIDLSNAGQNAAVTDTLGTSSATTKITVSYMTKGTDGSAVSASADISVGAGTSYANTAQGLISAINGSGLGLTASFGTAAQAGSTAVSAAQAANDGNGGATDTGIIISGIGVGTGTNKAGEVGKLSAGGNTDLLGGTLNIVGSDGASHSIDLGKANSTDTLQNLATTINGANYGVTATYDSTNHDISFTSANSAVTVTGTNLTDRTSIATSDTSYSLTAGTVDTTADLSGAGANALGSIVVGAATSLLSGKISLTDTDGTTTTPITLGTAGQTDTLANLTNYINTLNVAGATGITAALDSDGTTMTLTVAAGTGTAKFADGTSTDKSAATIPAVTVSTSLTDTPKVSGQFSSQVGALKISGAGSSATDTFTANTGTLTLGSNTINMGVSGKTDTLQNLAATVNAGNYGVTATYDATNAQVVFTSTNSSMVVSESGIKDVATGTTTPVAASNSAVDASQYYSVNVTGTVKDTSTTATINSTTTYGGTANTGIVANSNGSGGVATISYSDGAGQSLSATDLSNQTDAKAALTALNAAITAVAAQDGYIGAQINTLNAVSSVLSTQQQNVTAAQNAVQATDYATAASNMSKYQILSQTGISALAQANSMQQEVTKLLQ